MEHLDLHTSAGQQSRFFFTDAIADILPLIFQQTGNNRRIIAIIDEKVERLYGTRFPFEKIVIQATESNKSLQTVESICRQLMAMEADNHVFLLGVGGGITTDLTGFVAAVYKRGVEFAFVPTTLLCMIDAAIGGKSGVNMNGYKNMLGCIRQPAFVVEEISFLHSFSREELYRSLPELFKSLLIAGSDFEKVTSFFHNLDVAVLWSDEEKKDFFRAQIRRAVEIKAAIVARDEFDKGERRLLNLGHTFAHALERCTHLSHGEAVGIGLVLAAKNGHSPSCQQQIEDALRKCGLLMSVPASIHKSELLEAICQDKKITDGLLNLVVINGIGDVSVKAVRLDAIQL